jgi:SAM-dependent methyltransferase
MYHGPRPVFLDLLSLRRREPLESMWPPYAQFIRTFVYPLLACEYFGLRLDELLLVHRDGLEPARMLALCPLYRRLLPPFLDSVTLPALLEHRDKDLSPGRYAVRTARDVDEATFLLERLFNRARRLLGSQPPPPRRSAALSYMDSGHNYSDAEFAAKERFVLKAFESRPPKCVLDIGCNTGYFSLIAARRGARVVAIDHDPDAAGILWRSACAGNLDILPLAMDIARPPGACGWANRESIPFLDRARGQFDYVLLLALIHHLLVNERIPLLPVFELAAELTTRFAVIEYIDPADSQFQRIARGRDALHRDLNREAFEAAACSCFQMVESQDVSPTRRLYLFEKAGI